MLIANQKIVLFDLNLMHRYREYLKHINIFLCVSIDFSRKKKYIG